MQIADKWFRDIPQQFLGKRNIEVLIKAFSRQLQELTQVFEDLDTKLDLDVASGQNLDYVGTIIPLTRKEAGELAGIGVMDPVISDERYRQFLRYKRLKNTNDCTYYDIMQSIEILWRTDNIKYYEDPSRPATILIGLQTVDADAEIDPAFGKSLAVKPAGVALIYTVNYVVIIDSSQLEQVVLKNIHLKIGIPFFCNFVFDGSWLFDGSVLLNSRRRYWLLSAVRCAFGINEFTEKARSCTWSIGFKQLTSENMASRVNVRIAVQSKEDIELSLAVGTKIDSSGQEAVENVTAETKTSDYWIFDGTVLLDGSRNFNAVYRKEAVD